MGRPITVQVGPLATADDDAVSTTQKAAGAQYLVLQGAKTDGTTANNVAQSQTPTGAGASVTLNGTLASSVPTGAAVAYLGQNSRIYITSASDISNRTFAIIGLVQSPIGLVSQKETLTGPNASTVASQQLYYQITSITISNTAAGAITIGRAGTATLDVARRIIVTSGGDDTGITFTLAGTDGNGSPISEVITGVNNAAASSVLNFKTVTSALTSGAVATTVIVGTNTVADSQLVRFDDYAANSQTTIAAIVSGTVNYDVETSMDDPNALGNPAYQNPAAMNWIDSLDTAVVGATATKSSFFAYTPVYARVHLNSGSGTVVVTFRQAYLA